MVFVFYVVIWGRGKAISQVQALPRMSFRGDCGTADSPGSAPTPEDNALYAIDMA